MGLFGGNKTSGGEEKELSADQKWDYINLNDFRTSNCFTVFSYIWLWVLFLITIAVYGADTFTAVKLLRFNQWNSALQPPIPFDILKWIFAGCIILSFVLLAYEIHRAIRVMRRGGVAEAYLDPWAVQFNSVRFKTGWRRFLVFAKLTKSKKKMTWIALFVYFERKGAIRLLLADGPRQAVNAMALWTVMKASIIPEGEHAAPHGSSPIAQFFINLKTLAEVNETQTVILSTMVFTLVIWVISMIILILAFLMYILVAWHQIHNETLSQYCRRKIETRLALIVKARYEKVWKKEQDKRAKIEAKALKRGDTMPVDKTGGVGPGTMSRKPTIPMLGGSPPSKTAEFTMHPTDSAATLPVYNSRPGTPADSFASRQPSLPSVGGPMDRPVGLNRVSTNMSAFSDVSSGSNAPLLNDPSRPGTSQSFRQPPLYRSQTGSTIVSRGNYGPPIAMPTMPDMQMGPSHPGPSMRSNTGFSQQSTRTMSPFGPPSAGGAVVQNYSPLSAATMHHKPDPYSQRIPSPTNGPSYELTNVTSPVGGGAAAYPGQRSYTPASQGQRPPMAPANTYAPGSYTSRRTSGGSNSSEQHYGQSSRSNTPQPYSNGIGISNAMPRRDLSAPSSAGPHAPNYGRAQPPSSIPQRSATAPVPDYFQSGGGAGGRPLQRSETFGQGQDQGRGQGYGQGQGQARGQRWS